MRRRGTPGIFFFIFLFFVIGNVGSLFPLLIILGIVMIGAGLSLNASKKRENSYDETRHYTRSSNTDNQKISRINAFLKKWFRANHTMEGGSDLELILAGENYATLSSVDVYKNHSYLCTMAEFQNRYPESYRIVIDDLYNRANSDFRGSAQNDIVDVEATVTPPKPKEEKKPEKTQAEQFIDKINSLNTNIPDEQISKDLYATCAYLKQIDDLSRKLPNTKEKLNKLYEHYLPILIKILEQYESLQSAVTDPSYEETREKLSNTIQLINTAMKNIISSMTDQDFINLSADISTLEAVLKKDGLANDDQLLEQSRKKQV